MKQMTIKEVKELAMKYYEKGGDSLIECWSDDDILRFLNESKAHKKDLIKMFRLNEDVDKDMRGMSGWDDEIERKNCEEFLKHSNLAAKLEEDENLFVNEKDDDRYTPSSTNRDYSPSNPWDAPGMSIHDFI